MSGESSPMIVTLHSPYPPPSQKNENSVMLVTEDATSPTKALQPVQVSSEAIRPDVPSKHASKPTSFDSNSSVSIEAAPQRMVESCESDTQEPVSVTAPDRSESNTLNALDTSPSVPVIKTLGRSGSDRYARPPSEPWVILGGGRSPSPSSPVKRAKSGQRQSSSTASDGASGSSKSVSRSASSPVRASREELKVKEEVHKALQKSKSCSAVAPRVANLAAPRPHSHTGQAGTPGPGTYQAMTSVGTGSMYSLVGRPNNLSTHDPSPGPCFYNKPTLLGKDSANMWTSKCNHRDLNTTGARDFTPGAGAYQPVFREVANVKATGAPRAVFGHEAQRISMEKGKGPFVSEAHARTMNQSLHSPPPNRYDVSHSLGPTAPSTSFAKSHAHDVPEAPGCSPGPAAYTPFQGSFGPHASYPYALSIQQTTKFGKAKAWPHPSEDRQKIPFTGKDFAKEFMGDTSPGCKYDVNDTAFGSSKAAAHRLLNPRPVFGKSQRFQGALESSFHAGTVDSAAHQRELRRLELSSFLPNTVRQLELTT